MQGKRKGIEQAPVEFEAGSLEPLIQLLRNGECALIQDCTDELYFRTFKLFFCAADRLTSVVIGFDDQYDSIGELAHKSRFRFTAERRCADEDVIKRLAQFGEAVSIPFDRRVKAGLHQTRRDEPQILPAQLYCKIPNGTFGGESLREPNRIGSGRMKMQLWRPKVGLNHANGSVRLLRQNLSRPRANPAASVVAGNP